MYPWLVVSQLSRSRRLPPLVVLWTGFDIRPKVMVIALVSFFPIAVNTIDGIRATEPALLGMLATLGAGAPAGASRIARTSAALPYLFSGLRVAAAFVGHRRGLRRMGRAPPAVSATSMLTYNDQTATADVFAALCVLALIGVALFAAVGIAERLLLPWWRAE